MKCHPLTPAWYKQKHCSEINNWQAIQHFLKSSGCENVDHDVNTYPSLLPTQLREKNIIWGITDLYNSNGAKVLSQNGWLKTIKKKKDNFYHEIFICPTQTHICDEKVFKNLKYGSKTTETFPF